MITRDIDAFLRVARDCAPDFGPATARAAFLVAPEGFARANVVLAVLAGRAALVCADGFADPAVAAAVAGLYAPHGLMLSPTQRAAFTGNAIALAGSAQSSAAQEGVVWMSTRAARALSPQDRECLQVAGLRVEAVPLDAIEAAGGSLRCCVGEIF